MMGASAARVCLLLMVMNIYSLCLLQLRVGAKELKTVVIIYADAHFFSLNVY